MTRSTSAAVDAAKSRAQRLGARLKELGVTVRHTQALEALAAAEGFRDWNRYQASLEHAELPLEARGKRVLLVGRPVTGKTTACQEWAFKESQSVVLWVEGVGNTSSYDRLPAEVQERTEKIDVHFGPDGQFLSSLPVPNGKSWWIRLSPEDEKTIDYSSKAYSRGIDGLLMALRKTAGVWNRVVFEECKLSHSRGGGLQNFLLEVALFPWAPDACVVCNLQQWTVDEVPNDLLSHFVVAGERRDGSFSLRTSGLASVSTQMADALQSALNHRENP